MRRKGAVARQVLLLSTRVSNKEDDSSRTKEWAISQLRLEAILLPIVNSIKLVTSVLSNISRLPTVGSIGATASRRCSSQILSNFNHNQFQSVASLKLVVHPSIKLTSKTRSKIKSKSQERRFKREIKSSTNSTLRRRLSSSLTMARTQ